jgi:hypothetical protein
VALLRDSIISRLGLLQLTVEVRFRRCQRLRKESRQNKVVSKRANQGLEPQQLCRRNHSVGNYPFVFLVKLLDTHPHLTATRWIGALQEKKEPTAVSLTMVENREPLPGGWKGCAAHIAVK